jgi:hypothetical protein
MRAVTRSELIAAVVDFRNSLGMMVDRTTKELAVDEVLDVLIEALKFRTEREMASHCRDFDPKEVLARLDEESRRRRNTGPLTMPPGL